MWPYPVLVCFAALLASVAGQTTSTGDCCKSYLMDSDGRVALEFANQLAPSSGSVFNMLMLKLCARAPITIQLWQITNPVEGNFPLLEENPEFYELVWQMNYEPTGSTPLNEWIELDLDQAYPLETSYRLGLHAPNSYKFAIAHTFDTDVPQMYRSYRRMPGAIPLKNVTVFDTLAWPWSHLPYIRFCYRDRDGVPPEIAQFCINGDTPPIVVVAGPPGQPGAAGPPGPAGPAGAPGLPGENCLFSPDNPLTCAADDVLMDVMTNLVQTSNDLKTVLGSLNGGSADGNNIITGVCPDGFVKGPFGHGFCYYFDLDRPGKSFAEFQNSCWQKGHSLPMFINSQIEEAWIVNKIALMINATNPIRTDWTSQDGTDGVRTTSLVIGTSGIVENMGQEWVWYKDTMTKSPPFGPYTNWAAGEPLTDASLPCMHLHVTNETTSWTSRWKAGDCRERVYSVCMKHVSCY